MALFKKMFDQTVEGKGVLKEELTDKFTVAKFFRLSIRKFWRIAGLNIMFVLTNLPVFAILFYLAGYGSISKVTPLYPHWFGVIHGASKFVSNPAMSLLSSICSITVQGSYPGTWSYVFIGISLLTFLTFGPANTGMAFILRNYTREEPCDLWSDYWRTMIKNLKQSILFGAVDFLFVVMMMFDLYLFFTGSGSTAFFAIIGTAASIIYLFMRNYFYLIMITFDLPVLKIVKNALIFAFVNLKRNVLAFLYSLLCYVFCAIMLFFVTPIGALLLLSILFSYTAFVGIYAAYPAVKQYMIDPVIEDERKKRKKDEPKPIFNDVG